MHRCIAIYRYRAAAIRIGSHLHQANDTIAIRQCGRKTPARRTLPPFGAECPTIASKTAVMMAVVVLACHIYKKNIEMGDLRKFSATISCGMCLPIFTVCLNARYNIGHCSILHLYTRDTHRDMYCIETAVS